MTATINFGSASGSTKIQGATSDASPYTDSGMDSQGNTWTITTVTTNDKSFTQNSAYSQVGSSTKPVTSITFTTTLPESRTIKAFSAKFGGFSSTAGTVTLKVGDTTVGTGSLNASTDVTVSATNTTTSGTVLTVTVTDIAKGVKCYYVSYTYESSLSNPTVSFPQASYTTTYGETFTEPVLTCNSDGAKTYSSSNTAVAEVNESTGALTIKKPGNATITVNVAETATYAAGSASYDLKVIGTIQDGIIDFSINQDYGSGAVPGTDNNITTETTWTSGIVKLAVSGRNIWYNGESLRLYSNNAETGNNAGTITISIQTNDDLWITGLEVNGSNYDALKNGGISISKWAGKTKSITFTHSEEGGTARINNIKVHYTGPTISLTMDAVGYMTYFNKYANLSFGDLKAYIVTEIGENKVTLAEITKVPANTGVILKGTAGEHTLTIEESGDTYETNCLKKSSGFAATDSYNFWALAKKNDVVGFYKIPTGMTIPVGKCYLSVAKEASSARDFLGFIEENATRINAVENGQSTDEVFDLQGRQVKQPTKGLYIKNGKKVIIK